MEWKDSGSGHNQILRKEDFLLSYNPDTQASPAGVIDLILFGEDLGPETAICVGGKYYILQGDHREALQDLTLEEALDYFRNHPEIHGKTSDSLDE